MLILLVHYQQAWLLCGRNSDVRRSGNPDLLLLFLHHFAGNRYLLARVCLLNAVCDLNDLLIFQSLEAVALIIAVAALLFVDGGHD